MYILQQVFQGTVFQFQLIYPHAFAEIERNLFHSQEQCLQIQDVASQYKAKQLSCRSTPLIYSKCLEFLWQFSEKRNKEVLHGLNQYPFSLLWLSDSVC